MRKHTVFLYEKSEIIPEGFDDLEELHVKTQLTTLLNKMKIILVANIARKYLYR